MHTGQLSEVMTDVEATVDGLREPLARLSHAVHDLAELAFDERESARLVAELLAEHGYEARIGVGGLGTALRAEAGTGAPRVAILAEYDALPGVGHGCGHNVICASAVGAFLGLASHIEKLGGSVVLIGTPAEEAGSGKELLAQQGEFDDVDAVVMLHPHTGPTTPHATSMGTGGAYVTYHGEPSHAANSPESGRNALDGVVAAYQGIAMLRQHVVGTDRIHCIITEGGKAANIIPDVAKAMVMLRAANADELVALTGRVQAVLEGAATMTGTTLETLWNPHPPYLPVRSNFSLASRFAEHLSNRGHEVEPPSPEAPMMGGSTDLGNISLRVPSIHPLIHVPAASGVTMHTAEFATAAATPAADKALVDGAVAMALTAADFLVDDRFRAAVRDDFEAAGGAVDVAALLERGGK